MKNLPLFFRDWWLDAVCGENQWGVCLVEKNNGLLGCLPYYLEKKFFQKIICMPPLTPYLGPLIFSGENDDIARMETRNRIFSELLLQLPDFDFFNQSFLPDFTNWLPFYWAGYRQTTRYTYLITADRTEEDLWKNFRERVRRNIKKARDKNRLVVSDSGDIDQFYSCNQKTFLKNDEKIPYGTDLLARLHSTCRKNNCGRILMATSPKGDVYGAIYIVWDDSTVYYLMGGNDPAHITSGVSSLLMWEAIRFALKAGKNFDFEGSMLPGVEKFFRGFNADLKPYYRVYKANSLLIRLALSTRTGF